MRSREHAHDLTLWRAERLIRAGFPSGLAVRLAAEPVRDLHALIELAERGCPPDLAARIALPPELEREGEVV